jgi:hypothetical protein
VTTDVPAAFGFLFALYYFVKYLDSPTPRNLAFVGISFGIAQLIKFSLFLLIPFFAVVLFIFLVVEVYSSWRDVKRPARIRFIVRRTFFYARTIALVVVLGLLVIWPVYKFHVAEYPAELQKAHAEAILATGNAGPLEPLVIWGSDKPLIRPYAQYLLGVSMVFFRTSGGNTTYFLGEISAEAWKEYFPVVFLLKVPIPLLILIALGLASGVYGIFRYRTRLTVSAVAEWTQLHKAEVVWGTFTLFYWGLSIFGNLNLGLRHVLPTFPFIYLLLTGAIRKWLSVSYGSRLLRKSLLAAVLFWYALESLLTFPFYLPYYNEFAGGPAQGYRYAVDSNLDWGQDLKRLAAYVEENNISKIKVAYFGGDSPELRLGEKYEPLDPLVSHQKGWLAISASTLQGGRARPGKGFDQRTDHFEWLTEYEPVAKVGYSIFVYRIP